MNELYPLRENFRKVYIVDLSPSLCNVARERIRRLRLGDIVQVLCDDAVTFELPDFPDAEGNVDLITMSYSLSMMPSYDPSGWWTDVDILPWLIRSTNCFRVMVSLELRISMLLGNIHLPTTLIAIMELNRDMSIGYRDNSGEYGVILPLI